MPKVIEYFFANYSPAQRQYSTTEKECLRVILAIEKSLIVRLNVVTDHSSLLWLAHLKYYTGRMARWASRSQCYDIEFVHHVGKIHQLPDTLPRPVNIIDLSSRHTTEDQWYRHHLKLASTNGDTKSEIVDSLIKRVFAQVLRDATTTATLTLKFFVPKSSFSNKFIVTRNGRRTLTM